MHKVVKSSSTIKNCIHYHIVLDFNYNILEYFSIFNYFELPLHLPRYLQLNFNMI